MKTKRLGTVFLAAVLFLGLDSSAYPQEKKYPDNPVQIILAMGAGSGGDLFFRVLSEGLKKVWNVPVNVINKPGANGMLAAGEVASSRKDGYNVLGTQTSFLATVTVARPKGVAISLQDFDPVASFPGHTTALLCVRGDSKFKSLQDLVNYAREKPDDLVYGTLQAGSPGYLELKLLMREAKIKMNSISYKEPGEPVSNLLGGHIDLISGVDNVMMPHIKAGKVRALVAQRRSLLFPEIPVYAEAGYPGVNVVSSLGVLGPKGLPPEVIQAWESALRVVLKDPDRLATFKKNGHAANLTTGSELAAFWKEEVQRYSRFTPEELGWK